MGEIELSEVQLKVLKYLYDSNQEIAQTRGWTSSKIIKRAGVEKREGKAAILYLAESGLVKREVKKLTRSTGYKSKPTDIYKVSEKNSYEVEKFRISNNGLEYIQEKVEQMKITEDLKKMIDEDILKCDTPSYELATELLAKYKTYIDAVKGIYVGWLDTPGVSARVIGEIKNALIAFKTFGYVNNQTNEPQTSVTVQNKNENVNSITMNINLTFEQVREDIKNNGMISDDMEKEILERLEELETISKDRSDKKEKWKKSKGIIEWLLKQGVEIAVKVLPLILKTIAEG